MSGVAIKDPIHGTIELDELEAKIIDTSDFQRLRMIKQLATTYLVYPGANHTRFEHSLGTLCFASRIAQKLGLEQDVKRKVRLYALLHDLGHTAFSHEAECVTTKYLGNHEKIGNEKIMKGEIGDFVSENFDKKEIANFQSSAYAQIVSSDIGADRMDYLKRDSHYTGVAYGVIDAERIINKMYFEIENGNGELGIEESSLEASESLLMARFMMFSTVYQHHTVRIASAMLRRAIKIAITTNKNFDAEQFLEKGDWEMISVLAKNKNAGIYLDSLLGRKLYKEAHSLKPLVLEGKNILEIELELSSLANSDVIIDIAPNFFKLSGFNVKMHHNEKIEISKVSELVRALAFAEEARKKILILAPSKDREKVEEICKSYFI